MNKPITSNNAPQAIGPYSQAVLTSNTLYVSGQLPIHPHTNQFVGNCIECQTKQSLENILQIVLASNLKKEDIVKCTVYLKNMSDFPKMNEVYQSFFDSHKPARVTVEVSKLPKDALVEIDAIAVI
ncbi:MAG: RidA family protein [Firmicutes bacterium]|nr:RidA family protein [Bacillota bacterium]